MANFLDYLHWRGDLDFLISPFNEVDAAILSMLSYLDMTDIVPGCESGLGISIKDTSAQYFLKYSTTEVKPKISSTINSSLNSSLEELLRKLAVCPRFEGVQLSRFDKNTDYMVGQQFAAVTFTLQDTHPEHIVAFRGTDNTLIGWKEDFELVYMEQTPAQDSAQRYLEQALEKLPGRFIVCGHSKGGNLAVYAGSHIGSTLQDRILKIFNFDGPGFNFSVVDRTPFNICDKKILNLVPEESMVGMLLESAGERTVISSSARYAGQHNTFHWEVERSEFVRGNLADVAKLLDLTVKTWLTEISLDERAAFLETFFNLLGASEGTLLLSDPLQSLMEIKTILKKYSQLDKETKSLLNQVFGSLSTETKRTMSATIKKKLPGM